MLLSKFFSLSGTDWFLILFGAGFLYLVLEKIFHTPKEDIRRRLRMMEILSRGTEQEQKKSRSFQERLYLMAVPYVQRYIMRGIKKGTLASLELKLKQANDYQTQPVHHWAKKIVFAVIFTLIAALFGTRVAMLHNPIFLLGALVFGFFYPDLNLRDKIKKRRLVLKSALPDFLDLLASVAPASKGLEDAIARVCERMKGELSEEFERTLRDIRLGLKHRDAYNDLAIRCGIEQIQTLIGQINHAVSFGTSVEATLVMQADRIRVVKRQLAEIKARKAAITLTLPSVFLLFTILIMIAGPSIVQFAGAMSIFKP